MDLTVIPRTPPFTSRGVKVSSLPTPDTVMDGTCGQTVFPSQPHYADLRACVLPSGDVFVIRQTDGMVLAAYSVVDASTKTSPTQALVGTGICEYVGDLVFNHFRPMPKGVPT